MAPSEVDPEALRRAERALPGAGHGSAGWDARSDLVARAVRLVADGLVDREGVPGLAAALGRGVRQVEDAVTAELGAPPEALALAQRTRTARALLGSTTMPAADVALAAGFSSVRALDDAVRAVGGAAPGPRGAPAAPGPADGPLTAVALRLPFREPLEPSNLLGHLVATAVPGVEEYRGGAYHSTLVLPHGWGVVAVHPPSAGAFPVVLRVRDARDLTAAIARCRRLLDLDADPVAVDATLAADAALRPLVEAVPGRRVPGTLDPEAMALRAVLGQQVSTAAARTHAGRLAAALGEVIDDPDGGLTRLFPRAGDVAARAGELEPVLRLPGARRRTLVAVAAAIARGDVDLGAGADRAASRAALLAVPGVGPWTADTVAMRALGDPDAFLPGDLGVRRAAAALGVPDAPAALERASRAWSPWRAYAVQHLWGTSDHAVNSLPDAVGA